MAQVQEHDNIIRLIDVIWDCDLRKKHSALKRPSVCLVMDLSGLELEDGELFSLFDYVALEPFQDALAHYYFKQLISGALHCRLQRLLSGVPLQCPLQL